MTTGTCTRPHPTVSLTYQNEQLEIDEALAPLITEIWKAGIETWMSCQETEDGIAWIEFDSVDDIIKFINIVISYDVDVNAPYNRIGWNRNTIEKPLSDWRFNFSVMDMARSDSEQIIGGEVLFEASVGVYFPHEDIDEMLSKLRKHNACDSNFTASGVKV